MRRLEIFWCSVLRVRWLHAKLEPHVTFVIEGLDQTPLWFTAAGQDTTVALRQVRTVKVDEHVSMTRSRLTVMTRCRWPCPPQDGKEIAILFGTRGSCDVSRDDLHVPAGVLLQFQEHGSYRLKDVLTYPEWILDRSRMPAAEGQYIRRVVYLCDLA